MIPLFDFVWHKFSKVSCHTILIAVGKYFSIILSEKNSKSIYIPPGFAHGFCGLDKENYIIYSCTKYRSANTEVGIKYNDEDLKINWPVKKPIISKKDNSNYSFLEFKKKFKNV